eukprot:6175573-Pleurochrysis_carterae.AAC.2
METLQQRQAPAPWCVRIATASASGQPAPGTVLATGAWAQCAGCSKRKQLSLHISISVLATDNAKSRAVQRCKLYSAGSPIWRLRTIQNRWR